MEWDVKIDDKIEAFDARLSYEITGYKPINEKDSLDFNPDWFRQDALAKASTGNYSNALVGSKTQRDFWKERMRRCDNGYTINGYRVTGDNYFWLNFYRLKTSKKGNRAGQGRGVDFPTFLVFQYEYFHYVEICEVLGKDVGLLKSRGIGFSEIGACLCARPYITTPNYRVMVSAFSDNHLKPLLAKIWAQLDWVNEETETAFKRVRMVNDSRYFKRASMRDKNGRESGHMSEVEGVVADKPEKIRGDRTERLFFEEAGSDKIFKKKWIQGEALVKVMGDKIGTRIGWGTGGDKGPAIEGIRNMAFTPETFNILPYVNRHTVDGQAVLSSMFIPVYVTTFHLADKRGWVDPIKGKAEEDAIRIAKAADPKGLLMYKAEFCYTMEEALIGEGDNIFPREELAEQDAAIHIYKTVDKPKNGHLVWVTEDGEQSRKLKWRGGDDGKIEILEHPLKSEDGSSYRNLYVGGIDSIDIGKNDSSYSDKLSEFCIVIKKRTFGLQEPGYVAIYKERPRDIRDAYENAAKLLTYYGCKAVLEATRTAILTYFRDAKYLHLLMRRPRATMPDVAKGNSKMYGTPTPEKVIVHYRELIYDFILDYCHTIAFPEIIKQLLTYSDERKKDFDIVAAMGMAELGDEELSFRKPVVQDAIAKQFRDIGWYTNARGYKEYGKIPLNEEERNEKKRPREQDSWLYKELI